MKPNDYASGCTSSIICPNVGTLQRFLLGQISDSDATDVESHLGICHACQQTLHELPAHDTLVMAMQGQSPAKGDEESPPVEALMKQLSGLWSAGHNGIAGKVPETIRPAASDQVFIKGELPRFVERFLPPREPDEIGWLGSYRILRVLGVGGMGCVFLAQDTQLRRLVALKVMRPSIWTDEESRRRFMREAQAAAAIEHDHIVTIHQVGEDRGMPFLAMQLLQGEALDERLKREARLPAAEILRIGRETAEGLAAAHERDLIHRDVKPANIWLEQRSPHAEHAGYRVKILDFGLARAVCDDAALTQAGVIAGTPHYMAPEQARGKAIDARADLFSLGCVLYQMATGQLPFPGPDTYSTLTALATRDPKPPVKLNDSLPQPLSDLIMKLLAKEPQARPQSARDVIAAIKRIEHGHPQATVPARIRRRPVAAIILSVLTLALAVLGAQLGPGIYRFATNQGQLVIETSDPEVNLTVKGAGEEVTIRDAKTEREITLKAGKYHLELSDGRDGLKLSASEITLERGGKQIVKVWFEPAAKTFQEVRRFVGHSGHVRSVGWSSDGRRAISGGHDGTMQIWDVESGKRMRRILAGSPSVSKVAFSPNDRLILSAGIDGIIRIWDATTAQQLRTIELQGDQIRSAVLSPDGKQVLAGGGEMDQTMRLWDAETGNELRRFSGHGNFVWDVAFSPDGRRGLSGGWDNTVRLWDLSSGAELKRLEGHTDFVLGVLFTLDGRRAISASRDTTVRLWDLETSVELTRFEGHTAFIEGLALSRDGRRLLSAGYDHSLRLWDVDSGRELDRQQCGVVFSLAISPDGRHALSGGEDGSVRLWRLP